MLITKSSNVGNVGHTQCAIDHTQCAIDHTIGILTLLDFVALIGGSFATYPIWEPDYNSCDKTVYIFAFVSISLTWGFTILSALCTTCFFGLCVMLIFSEWLAYQIRMKQGGKPLYENIFYLFVHIKVLWLNLFLVPIQLHISLS